MLPKFLIPGAGKSGTTSLVYYLNQHPGVFVPKYKEPDFFSTVSERGHYHRGLEWYESIFDEAAPAAISGEASNLYLYDPESPRLIKKHLPDIKLIFIFREPAARAYSHYWEDLKEGRLLKDFSELVGGVKLVTIREFMPDIFADSQRGWAYIYMSDYAQHVRRYLALFPRESMRFYTLDQLKSSCDDMLKDIVSFLGLEPDFRAKDKSVRNPATVPASRWLEKIIRNPSLREFGKTFAPWTKDLVDKLRWKNQVKIEYPPMDQRSEQRLREFFAPGIDELEELTGLDLARWKFDI